MPWELQMIIQQDSHQLHRDKIQMKECSLRKREMIHQGWLQTKSARKMTGRWCSNLGVNYQSLYLKMFAKLTKLRSQMNCKSSITTKRCSRSNKIHLRTILLQKSTGRKTALEFRLQVTPRQTRWALTRAVRQLEKLHVVSVNKLMTRVQIKVAWCCPEENLNVRKNAQLKKLFKKSAFGESSITVSSEMGTLYATPLKMLHQKWTCPRSLLMTTCCNSDLERNTASTSKSIRMTRLAYFVALWSQRRMKQRRVAVPRQRKHRW